MANDSTAPATKQDVQLIMEFLVRNEVRIEIVEKELKQVREDVVKWKDEVKRHFDVVAESIRHDMLKGALADKVSQHDDRIRRLEERFVRG